MNLTNKIICQFSINHLNFTSNRWLNAAHLHLASNLPLCCCCLDSTHLFAIRYNLVSIPFTFFRCLEHKIKIFLIKTEQFFDVLRFLTPSLITTHRFLALSYSICLSINNRPQLFTIHPKNIYTKQARRGEGTRRRRSEFCSKRKEE